MTLMKPVSALAAPAAGSPAIHQKRELRAAMREKRAALPVDARAKASNMIGRKVIAILEKVPAAAPIAIYLAKAEEVDLDSVAFHLLRAGRHVVAPCHSTSEFTTQPGASVHEGFAPLRFRPAGERKGDEFAFDVRTGVFGVREPVDSDGNLIPPAAIGAFVLPGLAFDEQGYRLGYGGGWFDKALAGCLNIAVARPLLLGVCFDCQVVDAVPREAHDVRMDFVVTESRRIKIS